MEFVNFIVLVGIIYLSLGILGFISSLFQGMRDIMKDLEDGDNDD